MSAFRFYKIRRKGTSDQFSTGGATPKWSKTGKTWNKRGHVTSHLAQVNPPGRRGGWASQNVTGMADYSEAEIVTFEAQPVEVEDVSIRLAQIKARKDKERQEREEARRRRRENAERAELRRLKKKFPNG